MPANKYLISISKKVGETMASKWKCEFKPGMVSFAIRSGPGVNYSIIGYVLQKNSNVFYLDAEKGKPNSWYPLLSPNGGAGKWVCLMTQYVNATLEGGEPSKPATSPPPAKDSNIKESYTKPIPRTGYSSNISKSGGSAWNSGTGVNSASSINGLYPDKIKNSDIYKYVETYSYINKDLNTVEKNLNINFGHSSLAKLKQDMTERFNRFKIAYPEFELSKTFAHVFFTRPDLNLYESQGGGHYSLFKDGDGSYDLSKEPLYYYLDQSNKKLLLSLTRYFDTKHDFNPFLSNKAKSFELSDEYIKTQEYGETFTGWKVIYGRNNIESKTAGTFNISYVDDDSFNVYKIHKAWVDYISRVYRGQFKASKENRRGRILDYACSVYYFLCAEDGETILFWSKYYGVFPTTIPSSASSWSSGNLLSSPEYNITYAYAWKSDFDPITLAEFNKNSNGNYKYLKTYDPTNLAVGKTFAGAPFIESKKYADGYKFKLRFRT